MKRIKHSAVSRIRTCDLRVTFLVLYLCSTAAYTVRNNFKKYILVKQALGIFFAKIF